MSKLTKIALMTGVALSMAAGASAQDRKFVNIGTAGIGGGYYPTGGFICNVLNKSRKSQGHNVRCTVESTGGSVANLRSIQAGELDVAIVQSDWQYHSFNGTSKFEEAGANEDLRFLFSLHMDTAHLVSRADAGTKDFPDLKGKTVNIGNAGSGTEATMTFALSRYDETPEDYFGQATRLTSREQAQALCDGKIDAFFYTTGITASSITEATNTCDAAIVNWSDDTIDGMIGEFPYYAKSIIPAGTYRGQDEEVTTWGLSATLVATAAADEEVVYNMVKSVFDNFEDFKAQSTLYTHISREGSSVNGRSVPYHPGAERYFREVGLIK
ncbi:TAXI family TRAP transporter solute-binding subunit [Phaeobacter sp. LSS9]|uniref:TAXI family TRAP transporter solute-binding subunit n=1 Tax=unclassified Phaeobacter TaxID=2621772 RepID=UPI000E4C9AE4|nr:TAXI family TRAP transporter solute-binding subunit [Phaeobacter sp. LSS9]AXT34472.1 TAXI family TRAP transporter solute-binding subunit [Phaeobacter sp. LSS9]